MASQSNAGAADAPAPPRVTIAGSQSIIVEDTTLSPAALSDVKPPPAYDPRNGWQHAFRMIIEAMSSCRPFVFLVMQRLQGFVKQQLESRGCNSDCSSGHDFFDDGPAELEITGVSADGVFTSKFAHSFNDDQRVDDPVAVYFKNVPSWLAAAGVAEGAEM